MLNQTKVVSGGTPLLQINGLRKNFGGVRAIDGVDLTVNTGEIVGVIGPNGSGKTTTFNVVSGLVPANSGSILWGPELRRLDGLPAWSIFEAGISRTFQNIRLPLGLSVIENVLIGLYRETRTTWAEALIGARRSAEREAKMRLRAREALELVGAHLLRDQNKLAAELSYPDRRRLEIARAIVSRPKLLLLDEPTAGMNKAETDKLIDDVKRINSMGISIVLIEHKMKFVSELASRVVVLSFGRKIAEGAYEEIRSNEAVIEAHLGHRRDAQAG